MQMFQFRIRQREDPKQEIPLVSKLIEIISNNESAKSFSDFVQENQEFFSSQEQNLENLCCSIFDNLLSSSSSSNCFSICKNLQISLCHCLNFWTENSLTRSKIATGKFLFEMSFQLNCLLVSFSTKSVPFDQNRKEENQIEFRNSVFSFDKFHGNQNQNLKVFSSPALNEDFSSPACFLVCQQQQMKKENSVILAEEISESLSVVVQHCSRTFLQSIFDLMMNSSTLTEVEENKNETIEILKSSLNIFSTFLISNLEKQSKKNFFISSSEIGKIFQSNLNKKRNQISESSCLLISSCWLFCVWKEEKSFSQTSRFCHDSKILLDSIFSSSSKSFSSFESAIKILENVSSSGKDFFILANQLIIMLKKALDCQNPKMTTSREKVSVLFRNENENSPSASPLFDRPSEENRTDDNNNNFSFEKFKKPEVLPSSSFFLFSYPASAQLSVDTGASPRNDQE
jgi:hypothetical protein